MSTGETDVSDEFPETAPAETTGHPVVDAVLESTANLDGTPVDERVAVFEAAHDALRGALADAGNQQTG